MENMQLDYFYGDEAEQFVFYRIPKILVKSPHFRKVSDSAKLLYGLMLDRMGLSIKNGWVDEQNRAYIFFTVKDIMEQMCCGSEKATKIMKELDSIKGIGLIERIKQGQGKPAKIYLKKFVVNTFDARQSSRLSEIESQDFGKSRNKTFGNRKSGLSENKSAEFRQSKCNNNKYNDTDMNNNELNNINHIYPTASENQEQAHQLWIDRYNENENMVKANIDYESLCRTYDREIIDDIVNIMAEVLTVDKTSYTIEGCIYPAALIQKRFKEVNHGMIEMFLIQFSKKTDRIHNMKSYLITSIFNSPSTASAQLQNTINHDLYGGNIFE